MLIEDTLLFSAYHWKGSAASNSGPDFELFPDQDLIKQIVSLAFSYLRHSVHATLGILAGRRPPHIKDRDYAWFVHQDAVRGRGHQAIELHDRYKVPWYAIADKHIYSA